MSTEIKLDWEQLESMQVLFQTVFEKVDTASDSAYKVDNDISMRNLALKMNENIGQIISLIMNSFTSTDQNLKQQAQDIVGVEVHNDIASSMYSLPVQQNIQNNLDFWLTVNGDNAQEKIGINGNYPWCDAFANYVITTSGKKCPGRTISSMYPALANENLMHGYYAKDGALEALNNRWGSSISIDGYVPKTGDLVFFNWSGDNYSSVDHVGVIYVDPGNGVTYVVHGNYSNKVKKMTLEEFKSSSDHITIGDMTTYNRTH